MRACVSFVRFAVSSLPPSPPPPLSQSQSVQHHSRSSTNQPTLQPTNQHCNQPTNTATNQPTLQPTNQHCNQPTRRDQPINHRTNMSPYVRTSSLSLGWIPYYTPTSFYTPYLPTYLHLHEYIYLPTYLTAGSKQQCWVVSCVRACVLTI